ncbi:MAG: hypothetical protein HYT83_00140 [Candidatus Levybacteria bacterium]|nr:hypothetical protein [Candidatus Levybacteria bacterium]
MPEQYRGLPESAVSPDTAKPMQEVAEPEEQEVESPVLLPKPEHPIKESLRQKGWVFLRREDLWHIDGVAYDALTNWQKDISFEELPEEFWFAPNPYVYNSAHETLEEQEERAAEMFDRNVLRVELSPEEIDYLAKNTFSRMATLAEAVAGVVAFQEQFGQNILRTRIPESVEVNEGQSRIIQDKKIRTSTPGVSGGSISLGQHPNDPDGLIAFEDLMGRGDTVAMRVFIPRRA